MNKYIKALADVLGFDLNDFDGMSEAEILAYLEEAQDKELSSI